MKFDFVPAAEAEFEEAVDWYRARGPNLGEELTDAVEAAIQRITATPERFPQLEPGVRHHAVERFPT